MTDDRCCSVVNKRFCGVYASVTRQLSSDHQFCAIIYICCFSKLPIKIPVEPIKLSKALKYPADAIQIGIAELKQNRNINLKYGEFFKVELLSFLSSTLAFKGL